MVICNYAPHMKNTFSIILLTLLVAGSVVSCKNKETIASSETAQTTQVENKESSDLKVLPFRIDKGLQLPIASDDVSIANTEIIGDSLIMEVSYGGGCQIHEFELLSNGMYAKSLPMQVNVYLRHNANNDMCRAYFTRRIAFSIKGVQHPTSKELHLFINDNRENRLIYKY